MNSTRTKKILALGLLACLALGAAAYAETAQAARALGTSDDARNPERAIVVASISAASAAQVAQGQYGGEVLRVNKRGDVFRVKLRTSGGVIVVCVSATSGQIVGC